MNYFFRIAFLTAALVVPQPGFADSFDWCNLNGENFLGPVTDQGDAGSCEALATVGALEARYELTRDDPTFSLPFSAQQLLCAGADNVNTGGRPETTLAYLVSTGVVTAAELPYTARNSSPLWPLKAGWRNRVCKVASVVNFLPSDTASIKAELKEYGPLLVSVSADDLGTTALGTTNANHAVVVVGYQDDASEPGGGHWIVQNSWGTDYGSQGDPAGYYNVEYGNIERQDDIHAISGPAYVTGPLGAGTWSGGSGAWSAGPSVARWALSTMSSSLASTTWANGENDAVFSGSGGTISLDNGLSAHGLIFKPGATGYSLSGGSLIVTAGGIVAGESVTISSPLIVGAPETWQIASGKTLAVNGSVNLNISPLTINVSSTATAIVTGTISDVTTDPVLAGLLTDTSSLTKSGKGLLILTAANTYSSETTIASGTLQIDNPLALQNSAVNLAGGVLDLSNLTEGATLGALKGKGNFNFGNYDLTLGNASGSYSGALSGSGTLYKSGTGWQILRGKDSYTGGTDIQSGMLTFGSAASVPASGTITVGAGGYVGVRFAPTAKNFFNQLNESNFLGVLGIETTVTNLNLSNFNPAMSIGSASAGTLNGSLTLPSGDMTYSFGGGGGALTVASKLTDDSSGYSRSVVIGSGAATPCTVALTGNNSYTGGTIVDSGTLRTASDRNLGNGNGQLTLSDATWKITGPNPFSSSRNISLTGSATLDLANSYAYTELDGDISGTGSLTVSTHVASNYLEQLSLTGNNNYSGGTLLNSGIALEVESDLSLGTGALTFNGGMLSTWGSQFSTNKAIQLIGFAYLDADRTGATFNGPITGSGSLVLNPYAVTGELFILGGTNTYTGDTFLTTGTLEITNPLALQDTAVSFTHGGLDLSQLGATGATIGALNGSGNLHFTNSLTLGNATGDYSGALSGDGVLMISGSGSQTLSGKDSYTGGTYVESGILTFGKAAAIPAGSGSISVDAGGYVGAAFAATTANFFSKFDAAATAGVIGIEAKTTQNIDLTGFNSAARLGSAGSGVITGTITPQANVYQFGGGGGELDIKSPLTNGVNVRSVDFGTSGNLAAAVVTLSASNSYSGGTTFDENGWGQISNDDNLGSGALTFNGGTLEITATSAFSSAKAITINYSNTPDGYDGWIMFDGATTAGATLSGPINLVGNATGLFWNEPDVTISGPITGSGSFVKSGSGTMILSSACDYTGGTVVRRGTLELTGSIGGTVNVNSGATFNVSQLTGGFNVPKGNTFTADGAVVGALNISGTLTGSGSTGAVTMTGGFLASGSTPRTFSTGNLSLDSASTVQFQLSLAGNVANNVNDLINVYGNLTLGGSLDIIYSTALSLGEYRLFNYTGALNGINPALDQAFLEAYPGSYILDTLNSGVADQVDLVVEDNPALITASTGLQAVPEPSAWAMLILGAAALGACRPGCSRRQRV